MRVPGGVGVISLINAACMYRVCLPLCAVVRETFAKHAAFGERLI